jgi:lipopolysaccharide export LptBFGC system permease protein LptF
MREQGLQISDLTVSVRQDENERMNQFAQAQQNSRNRIQRINAANAAAAETEPGDPIDPSVVSNSLIDVTA